MISLLLRWCATSLGARCAGSCFHGGRDWTGSALAVDVRREFPSDRLDEQAVA